jgi:hypothetical protein
LVDQIWIDRRPILPSTDINAVDIKYTGISNVIANVKLLTDHTNIHFNPE